LAEIYDFEYHPSNVYGHVVALLKNYNVGARPGVHLDVGCGYGRIAEQLVAASGLTYVGVDGSEDGLVSIRQRGFEAHQMTFGRGGSAVSLRKALGGREIRSISCIDMLEHVPDPREILLALREVVEGRIVPLVTSVPNVAHSDVAIKLMFGRLDPSDSGILDRTHITHFTDRSFTDLLLETGWQQVAANDVPVFRSDQFWPSDHLAFLPGTALSRHLRLVRERADRFAYTNQLVRLSLPREAPAAIASIAPEQRPFLTVVMASDGRDIDSVRDLLTCLAAQTDLDFEFVLVGYDIDYARHILLLEVIEWHDAPIRQRGHFVRCEAKDYAGALNEALALAAGQYAVVVDNLTTLDQHWVESFRKLAVVVPGRVLVLSHRRAPTAHGISALRGCVLPISEGSALETVAVTDTDFLIEIWSNGLPPATIAFPVRLTTDQSFGFDSNLPTICHWDMAVRAAALCGIKTSEEVSVTVRAGRFAQPAEIEKMHSGFRTIDFILAGEEIRSLAKQKFEADAATIAPDAPPSPFLSILVALVPVAPQKLLDLVVCFANQTDRDFELIAVTPECGPDEMARLIGQLREFPREIYRKIKLCNCPVEGQAAAFNSAFQVAEGRYFVVAQGDSLPCSNFVASLRELAIHSRDEVLRVGIQGALTHRGESEANPSDLMEQFERDIGPALAYAFPRALCHDNHIKFDESLERAFLWDFRVRVLLATSLKETSAPSVVVLDVAIETSAEELARLRAGFECLNVPFPFASAHRIRALELENADRVALLAAQEEELFVLRQRLTELERPSGFKRLALKLRGQVPPTSSSS
jgi:hypothetical protein